MADESSPLRVLLVEDHDVIAEALTWLLRDMGIRVEWARSLDAAFAIADGQHILLTDYRLPDGTGIELFTRLGSHRMPRCILMSSFLDDHIRQTALRRGFDFCLDKQAITDDTLRDAILGPG